MSCSSIVWFTFGMAWLGVCFAFVLGAAWHALHAVNGHYDEEVAKR